MTNKFKPVYPDIHQKPGTQCYRIYRALKIFHSLTNRHFIKIMNIYRYGGRIMELRDALEPKGWTIATERVDKGLFKYTLERL
jgi:hypothetical protein